MKLLTLLTLGLLASFTSAKFPTSFTKLPLSTILEVPITDQVKVDDDLCRGIFNSSGLPVHCDAFTVDFYGTALGCFAQVDDSGSLISDGQCLYLSQLFAYAVVPIIEQIVLRADFLAKILKEWNFDERAKRFFKFISGIEEEIEHYFHRKKPEIKRKHR